MLLALLVLAGAAASSARGQGRPAALPAASLTTGVQETVLPNGLTVLVKEVRSAPVVSFSVWYRVGSRNEHTGITGCPISSSTCSSRARASTGSERSPARCS